MSGLSGIDLIGRRDVMARTEVISELGQAWSALRAELSSLADSLVNETSSLEIKQRFQLVAMDVAEKGCELGLLRKKLWDASLTSREGKSKDVLYGDNLCDMQGDELPWSMFDGPSTKRDSTSTSRRRGEDSSPSAASVPAPSVPVMCMCGQDEQVMCERGPGCEAVHMRRVQDGPGCEALHCRARVRGSALVSALSEGVKKVDP